jgi:hypothetical protein
MCHAIYRRYQVPTSEYSDAIYKIHQEMYSASSLVWHESSSPSLSVKPPIFCCNGDLIITKLRYVSPTFAPPCVVYDVEGWPKVQATLCVIQPLVHINPLPREFNPYSRSECSPSHIFFYITSIGLVRMTSNKKIKHSCHLWCDMKVPDHVYLSLPPPSFAGMVIW